MLTASLRGCSPSTEPDEAARSCSRQSVCSRRAAACPPSWQSLWAKGVLVLVSWPFRPPRDLGGRAQRAKWAQGPQWRRRGQVHEPRGAGTLLGPTFSLTVLILRVLIHPGHTTGVPYCAHPTSHGPPLCAAQGGSCEDPGDRAWAQLACFNQSAASGAAAQRTAEWVGRDAARLGPRVTDVNR